MKDTLCVILGGGRGTRLFPLTRERCKPAIPLAGKYRLIDIPVSNCLNSGLNKIYVLTQFNSESLNMHIARTYNLDRFSGGFVEIMAAEQSMENPDWFQGTADSVRQCLKHFNDPLVKRILILSGDQLYKFDFKDLLEFHLGKKAQITIACNSINPDEVAEYGIMGVDQDARIMKFIEKPGNADEAKDLAVSIDGRDRFLASMGIYLFEKDVLVEILTRSKKVDFGKGILPEAFKHKKAYAFTYKGYWRDIGTIKAFYDENLMLTDPIPEMDMFDEYWPFFTRQRNLPPAKVRACRVESSIIAEGCIIEESEIRHSVIGLRSRVKNNTRIEDSILLGCDFYETLDEIRKNEENEVPSLGIGKNCYIKKAIIDKNARIGDDVMILNKKNEKNKDGNEIFIRNGIVVITKNAVIKRGTVI